MDNNIFSQVAKQALSEAYWLMGLEKINESSIERILQHGKDGFIIISASRGAILPDDFFNENHNTDDEPLFNDFCSEMNLDLDDWEETKAIINSQRGQEWLNMRNNRCDKELRKDIIAAGYTFSTTYGGYKGQDGVEASYEPSFIVYPYDRNGEKLGMYELVNFGMEECEKFYQDCFLVKMPGRDAMYINSKGEKTSSHEGPNTKINREGEEFFTTARRQKGDKQRLTFDIDFDNNYVPEKMFEGKFVKKNFEYIDRMRRSQNGEIFL